VQAPVLTLHGTTWVVAILVKRLWLIELESFAAYVNIESGQKLLISSFSCLNQKDFSFGTPKESFGSLTKRSTTSLCI